MPPPLDPPPAGSRRLRVLLWILAVVATLAALVYQRRTGPTYPLRVGYAVGGAGQSARLTRSGTTGENARVAIPVPPEGWSAALYWRRYPTEDAFAVVPMAVEGAGKERRLEGRLPQQPTAGKVEYYVVLSRDGEAVRIPPDAEEDPILRYKNAVPPYVLFPHILVIFLAMLFGVRAGLAAAWGLGEMRRLAWTALGLVTLGGLVLGPILQKIAFGEFWTGWPRGYDLTDNKALVAWLAWLVACLWIGGRRAPRRRFGRTAVILAALVLVVVYSIPHSLRGSELDYRQLEEGVPAEDAIRTG